MNDWIIVTLVWILSILAAAVLYYIVRWLYEFESKKNLLKIINQSGTDDLNIGETKSTTKRSFKK